MGVELGGTEDSWSRCGSVELEMEEAFKARRYKSVVEGKNGEAQYLKIQGLF